MKNVKSLKGEKSSSRNVRNQAVKLAYNEDFNNFIFNKRKELEAEPEYKAFGIPSSHFSATCHLAIREFLHANEISKNWVEPFYKMITTEEVDLPLENGLGLTVGGEDINSNSKKVHAAKNEELRAMRDESIHIVISGKVSIDRIIQFIKTNRETIKQLQDVLKLPEVKPMRWKMTGDFLHVKNMKQKKQTYSQIVEKLQNVENQKQKTNEKEVTIDESNLRTRDTRYKKYLAPKKK